MKFIRRPAQALILALTLLAQPNAAFAAPPPASPVYSDSWTENLDLRYLDQPLPSLIEPAAIGSLCAAAAVMTSRVIMPNRFTSPNKLAIKVAYGLATLIAAPSVGYGCGAHIYHQSLDEQRGSVVASILGRQLTGRVQVKLSYDLRRHLEAAQASTSPHFQPLRQAIATRSLAQIRLELSELLEEISRDTDLASIHLRFPHLLLDLDDRALLRYLYALRRADREGRPLESVSNRAR